MSNILLAGRQRTENTREIGTMNRWRARIVLLLTASGLFLYALPSPSLTYGAVVLLHVALGALFIFLLLPLLGRLERTERLGERYAWAPLACGAILGLALIYLGTPHRLKGWFYAHIFLCAAGVLLLAASWMASRGWLGKGAGGQMLRLPLLLAVTPGSVGGRGLGGGSTSVKDFRTQEYATGHGAHVVPNTEPSMP